MDLIGQLVKRTFGPEAVVVAGESLGGRDVGGYYTERHPHLSRYILQGGPSTPRSVIVKTRRADGDSRSDVRFLRNERAALEFLTSMGIGLAPRYFAGDDAAGFVMMEDLGSGPSPDLLLVRPDPDAARAGLVAFARSLGRLHASTIGHAATFYRIRAKLGPADPVADRVTYGGASVIETWNELKDRIRASGVLPDPAAADDDVDELIQTLAEPGDYLALSNGDVCPQNARLFGDSVRFIDFDGAVFRHALLDAAYLRFPFVDCPCRSLVPDDVRQELEVAYRRELAANCPSACDDASFERGMTAACAAKTIQRALGFASVADADSTYGMRVSKRAWLQATIGTLTTSSERPDTLRGLRAWFGELSNILQAQWHENPPAAPLYPAFATRAETA